MGWHAVKHGDRWWRLPDWPHERAVGPHVAYPTFGVVPHPKTLVVFPRVVGSATRAEVVEIGATIISPPFVDVIGVAVRCRNRAPWMVTTLFERKRNVTRNAREQATLATDIDGYGCAVDHRPAHEAAKRCGEYLVGSEHDAAGCFHSSMEGVHR